MAIDPEIASRVFGWGGLADADLIIDAVYEGGNSRRGKADEVLSKLLPGVSNSGGFRIVGSAETAQIVILYSTGTQVDWPDEIDLYRGTYTYFGDNRTPGKDIHDTPRRGNVVLRRAFDAAHGSSTERQFTPVFLLFEKTGAGHSVRFRGLAVPGSREMSTGEDLVAIWRVSGGVRFQNYKSTFTILDIAKVDGNWIRESILNKAIDPRDPRVPKPLAKWYSTGHFTPLTAPQLHVGRNTSQQTPDSAEGLRIIELIRDYCSDDDFLFEAIAVEVWRLACSEAIDVELTRRYRDGGRDALGKMYIGPLADRLGLDFSIEAKNYAPSKGVGVKEVARLVSRLKTREFGVLITTSYLSPQAYREIREDKQPVIVISGSDIAAIVTSAGLAAPERCRRWLESIVDSRIK
jgi:hypothetical protein